MRYNTSGCIFLQTLNEKAQVVHFLLRLRNIERNGRILEMFIYQLTHCQVSKLEGKYQMALLEMMCQPVETMNIRQGLRFRRF